MSQCTWSERDQSDTLVICGRKGSPVTIGTLHTVRCDDHTPEAERRLIEMKRIRVVIVAIVAGLIAFALLRLTGRG